MTARHGTANRYNQGCRCEACRDSHRLRAADYRQRSAAGGTVRPCVADLPHMEPGPVESGVQAEISDSAAEARPGLAQAALALARVLDNPKALSQKAPAAKALADTAVWRWCEQ
jgi:hypothetical protein